MKSHESFSSAWRTLLSALGLFGRNFASIAAVCAVPALARMALFIGTPWMSDAFTWAVEAIVGLFRFVLLYIAFRLVWPDAGAAFQSGAFSPVRLRVSYAELVWQLGLLALVSLVLNLAADAAGHALSGEANAQEAYKYGLKNLFVIPLWMVHLLSVTRRALEG